MILLHADVLARSQVWWLDWHLDPSALFGISLAGLLYGKGFVQRRSDKLHPIWRPVVFYLGLVIVLAALVSPLDGLADVSFSFHMVQHILLVLIAPPLILLGAPTVPILRGMPRLLRKHLVARLSRVVRFRRILSLAISPVLAWAIFISIFLGWHVPGLYDRALNNEGIHILEHLMFSAGAFLFWWNVIDPIPLRPNLSLLARLPYVFVTTVPNFVLGAFLVFAATPLYSYPDGVSLTALEDQQLGGLLMWIPGALILLLTLFSILGVMLARDERNRRREELGK